MENVSALLYRGLGDVLGDLAEIGYDAEWHCVSAADVGAPHLRERIWIVAYPNSYGKSDRAFNAEAIQAPDMADSNSAQREGGWLSRRIHQEHRNSVGSSWWEAEPALGRVANGVPNQSHRLKAIGNAVVPQIPELIGRAILNRRVYADGN
jgi:DNA (cytosine-5)-methyltransferase 1